MKWFSIIYRVDIYKCLWLGCLLCLALFLQQYDTLKQWDNQLYDRGLALFSRDISRDIVIVAIDKNSVKKLGRLPWSRRQHAQLINYLSAVGVKAIGLDLVFDKPNPKDMIGDRKLIQAIHNNGRVILPVFPEISGAKKTLPTALPWPELVSAAAGFGHVDVELDNDGVVRSTCLQAGVKGSYWPSFALALLSINEPNKQRFLKGDHPPKIENCPCWQGDFRIEIPFASANQHFKQVSYVDVLTNADIRDSLRGKIVVVGATASGLTQMFKTPLHKNASLLSGVEINAHVLDVLINNLSIQKLPRLAAMWLTLSLLAIPIIYYSFFCPQRSLHSSLFFCLLTVIISGVLLKQFHLWYGPVPVLVLLTINHLLWRWQRLDCFAKMLFSERQLAKAALHCIGDAVITTSCKGFIEYMNPAAELLTGYTLRLASGSHIDSILRFNHQNTNNSSDLDSITHGLVSEQSFQTAMPWFLINPRGEEYAIQIKGTLIKNDNKHVTGMVFALNDLTNTLHISSQLAHLATHDALTGLPNRILLQESIANAILAANRNGTCFALLFIDLDGFKKINDGMGHVIGDLVLKEMATRLCADMRQLDTAARWGGDEFVVLLNHLPNEDTISPIANKLLQRLAPPYFFAGQQLYVTSSIGISIFPKDGLTSEALLTQADTAMYRVKEKGKNNYSFYANGLNESAKKRLTLEKEMYDALDAGHFEVFYQPQVDIKTHRIVGAEALLRWHHPQKGLLLPGKFISLAEDIGLINPIGDWLLNAVCSQQHSWQQTNLPVINVAINLSHKQFLHNDLCRRIDQALIKHHLQANSLKVEITENVMIKDIDRIAQILCDIKALGVSIAIDDFGIGYFSLNTLKNLPIDQLKIDKSFVAQLSQDSDAANIIQTIIVLGHNMHMNVVAKGVETLDQFNQLNRWHCDLIQGYYFSRPVTAMVMTDLLAKKVLSHPV
jgi:diguanylate cyclase (GGDEF)-like protein/PAS domain S-box-containing protein